MKTRIILSALAMIALAAFSAPASAQTDGVGGFGYAVGGFLDENGDGFNDLAPDADGDGIPNGVDPDYAPPMDGTGNRLGAGDGICDEDGFQYRQGFQYKHSNGAAGFGPGDGTGNGGTGPGDGTGFGPGDGTCIPALDGSGEGPNGRGQQR